VAGVTFEIANIRLNRGINRFRIPVSELADGTPIEIPVIAVQGKASGPVLYVQGAMHGDEVNGTEIARRVTSAFGPDELTGTLVSVPIANIPAYLTRSRGFALEERGPNNMAGYCPGNPNGLLTERIAYHICKEILAKAQYVIDLHTGLTGANCYPFTYVVPSDGGSKTLESRIGMTKASGFPLVFWLSLAGAKSFRSGAGEYSRTFGGQSEALGIPRILLEMGEGGRIQEDLIEFGVKGIVNIMKHLGMLKGELNPERPQKKFSKYVEVLANRGGLLNVKAQLGQELKKNETIAEISSPFEIVETIVAPEDGVLIRHLTMAVIYPGAEVAWIAKVDS
jgi:predicted deacylase